MRRCAAPTAAQRATWQSHSRFAIGNVLARMRGRPEHEIREALAAAYPFGPRDRASVPYRIWSEEVRRQLSVPQLTLDMASPGPARKVLQ